VQMLFYGRRRESVARFYFLAIRIDLRNEYLSSLPDRPPKMLARQAKSLFCVKGGQRVVFAIHQFDFRIS